MRRYILYIAVFVLLCLPAQVSANSCDNRTLNGYRELASNITTYYNYRWVDGETVFDIVISNIPDDVFIENTATGRRYTFKDWSTDYELTLKGYKPNQRIRFDVYVNAAGCYAFLDSRTIILPIYNEYANTSVCEGVENFTFCHMWLWSEINISYEEFVERVEAHKQTKEEKISNPLPVVEPSLLEKVIEFVGNYYIFLVGIVVAIVIVTAIVKKKAVKKNQFDFKV